MDLQVLQLILSKVDNQVLDVMSRSALAEALPELGLKVAPRVELSPEEELRVALIEDRVDNLSRLLPIVQEPGSSNELLLEAVTHNSIDSIAFLLKRRDVDPNYDNSLPLLMAVQGARIASVDVLLRDRRTRITTEVIREATRSGNSHVLYSIIMDKRARTRDERTQHAALQAVIRERDVEMVDAVLDWKVVATEQELSDAIIEGNAQIVALLLEVMSEEAFIPPIQHYLADAEAMKMNPELIDLLVRQQGVNFNLVPQQDMTYIIKSLSSYIQDVIRGCVYFFNKPEFFNAEDVVRIISDPQGNLYSHLLRELILKRSNLLYYTGWLIEEMKYQDIATRRIVKAAASSVLTTKRVVHTSSLFTALSGFLLLANARSGSRYDARGIIELMEREEGVTEEGLSLAGGLIGAFLGYRRLDPRPNESRK